MINEDDEEILLFEDQDDAYQNLHSDSDSDQEQMPSRSGVKKVKVSRQIEDEVMMIEVKK